MTSAGHPLHHLNSRLIGLALTWVLAGWTVPASGAQEACVCATTVWGTSGATLTESTDVLDPGSRRLGLSVVTTRGGSGNRLDALDEPGSDSETVTLTRGTLAFGLADDTELAIMAPYAHLTPEGASGTGGRGDLGLSIKQRIWGPTPQRPAGAIALSYVAATAARDRRVQSVTHDAVRASVVLDFELPTHPAWFESATATVNLGGLFKDQFRTERDEMLLYNLGVTWLLPKRMGGLFDPDTGLFGRRATGRYTISIEAAGTLFRGDRAPNYDDSIALIGAVQYRAHRWGAGLDAHSVTYSRDSKHHASGLGVRGSVAF